jgi:transposase
MLRIRVVRTASGSRAVQIIYYHNRNRKIFKHIGSGSTDEQIHALKLAAQDFINQYSPALPLFEDSKSDNLLLLNKSEFLGVYYTFFHEVTSALISKIGLNKIKKKLLLDLVIMRLLEPSSKLHSIELLNMYFGLQHRRQSYYKYAPKWLDLKSKVEEIVVQFAKQQYAFNYDLLFYDVTTLYFETFQEDELRQNGFSKDNKSQQPQILIGLMVNEEGFPVAYEVFSGSTFEGHTILPVVKEFIKKHSVKDFTVVADAAMISAENVRELLKNDISYIVGARLGNVPAKLIEQIDKSLHRQDGENIRIKTDIGFLICSYSAARYRKDKYEMEKQIQKAKSRMESPSKNKKLKFTKSSGEKIELNEALIEKTKKLLGVKGYYTNVGEEVVNNRMVMERYHELYKIEQAFRISKNDLQTRPIFHFKEQPIKLHILICFMALVISKHIELATRLSIRKIIAECKKITDARIFNQITGKEITIRTKLTPEIVKIMQSLNLPH